MEQRISVVTLGVANLDRSRNFYERLGWRWSVANAEGVVFFQAAGMALALYPRSELAKDAKVAEEGQGFAGITLAYKARSRDEVKVVLADVESGWRETIETRSGSFLGWLFRLLF